jgi:hypothetical protein
VLELLPLGKGFEAQAGWFLLLGLAAGESGQTLDTGVTQMLTDLGRTCCVARRQVESRAATPLQQLHRQRGYAFVAVDMAGTARSAGCSNEGGVSDIECSHTVSRWRCRRGAPRRR